MVRGARAWPLTQRKESARVAQNACQPHRCVGNSGLRHPSFDFRWVDRDQLRLQRSSLLSVLQVETAVAAAVERLLRGNMTASLRPF